MRSAPSASNRPRRALEPLAALSALAWWGLSNLVLFGWSFLAPPPYLAYPVWSIAILAPYPWLHRSRWWGAYWKLQCLSYLLILGLRLLSDLWLPVDG